MFTQWWARCSAQIWSQVEDFEFLGEAMLEACKEILEEFGDESAPGTMKQSEVSSIPGVENEIAKLALAAPPENP